MAFQQEIDTQIGQLMRPGDSNVSMTPLLFSNSNIHPCIKTAHAPGGNASEAEALRQAYTCSIWSSLKDY